MCFLKVARMSTWRSDTRTRPSVSSHLFTFHVIWQAGKAIFAAWMDEFCPADGSPDTHVLGLF